MSKKIDKNWEALTKKLAQAKGLLKRVNSIGTNNISSLGTLMLVQSDITTFLNKN